VKKTCNLIQDQSEALKFGFARLQAMCPIVEIVLESKMVCELDFVDSVMYVSCEGCDWVELLVVPTRLTMMRYASRCYNDIRDFQRADSVKILVENGKVGQPDDEDRWIKI